MKYSIIIDMMVKRKRKSEKDRNEEFQEIKSIIDMIRAFRGINQEDINYNDFDDELNRNFQCSIKSKLVN